MESYGRVMYSQVECSRAPLLFYFFTSLYHSSQLYLTVLDSALLMALLHSTRVYIALPWHYFSLLDSTVFYHSSTLLYLTLCQYTMAPLYLTLHHSSMPIYTSLYLNLQHFTVALLHSTCMTLHYSPWLYFTVLDSTSLQWFYFTLLHSTLRYLGYIALYLTLLHSIVALLHFT